MPKKDCESDINLLLKYGAKRLLERMVENNRWTRFSDLHYKDIFNSTAILAHRLRELQSLSLIKRKVLEDRSTYYIATEKAVRVLRRYYDLVDVLREH